MLNFISRGHATGTLQEEEAAVISGLLGQGRGQLCGCEDVRGSLAQPLVQNEVPLQSCGLGG